MKGNFNYSMAREEHWRQRSLGECEAGVEGQKKLEKWLRTKVIKRLNMLGQEHELYPPLHGAAEEF